MFLLVLTASVLAPAPARATRRVLWLLLASTGLSIFGYPFHQDWFHTIIFGSYVGTAYIAWVTAMFIVLVDWVLNRGRGTTSALGMVGLPC